MYGCSLWSLSSSSLKLIEVALNKLLRKLFYFPRNSHSAIVHCVAHVDSLFSVVFSPYFPLHCRHHHPWFSPFFLFHHKWCNYLQVIITSMVPETFLIIPLKNLVLLVLYVKLDFFFYGYTLLMKILSIICHVPSSLFSYFLVVSVLFAPILVCSSFTYSNRVR